MTAGFGLCRRSFAGALTLGLLACSISAEGQEIRWQPQAATGNVVCMPGAGACGPREVILSDGGVTVTLFLEVSGWDTAGGGHPGDANFFLGAFQGTVDHRSYEGGLAAAVIRPDHPGNPGTTVGLDLNPVGQDTGMGFEGAFQALKVCASDPFDPVGSSDLLSSCTTATDCPAGNLCVDRWDYVYYQLDSTATVSTATIDYSWSAASVDCREDPRDGTRFYGGTLLLEVPAGAKGSYNVAFFDDVNFTLFNSCPGPLIPGLIHADGTITIQTGKCCEAIGGAGGCTDNLTSSECDARPGPRLWDPTSTCADGCIECLVDLDCNDGNACTDDTCTAQNTCDRVPNYAVGVDCCNPADGSTTVIDDGIQCTDDVCDDATGGVAHNPLDGGTCTDAEVTTCFFDFTCVNGVCEGTDINTVDCSDISQCPEGSSACDAATGKCVCIACTGLVINVDAGAKPDPNCFLLGGKVDMQVAIEAGSSTITGGQFLINYDNTCLDFQSIGACEGSIFDSSPYKVVDEGAGSIFYVSLVDPFKRCSIDGSKCFDAADCDQSGDPQTCDLTTGSKGPADLACLSFVKMAGCDECQVCFDSVNPQNTILTDDAGNAVDICEPGGCSKAVRTAGMIRVHGPDGADVNSDCGLPSADITWDMPWASDSCDGGRAVSCSGAFAHNVGEGSPPQAVIDGLVMGGGVFTQGKWFFQCTASNTCGNVDQHVWTVNVSDKNALDVEVHLAPPIIAGALSRCICFDLYADCFGDPTEQCTVLDFGPPWNFRGHARDSLKIAKDNYLCVTAIDPLHTLRSSADIQCVGNAWNAVWKGDPELGGNWLVGGNLDYVKPDGSNSPNTIDVLDFGKFIVEIARGAIYADGNTTCADMANAPHGDINGDGLVDNIDFGIIQMNFLRASKNACCGAGAEVPVPIAEITVKELRAMGLGELVIADLNRDGVLNMDDMTAYQQGTLPFQPRKRGAR
ncbi:MAG: hypothetical protein ACE5HE_01300 [Phycisphaerae bacterium]